MKRITAAVLIFSGGIFLFRFVHAVRIAATLHQPPSSSLKDGAILSSRSSAENHLKLQGLLSQKAKTAGIQRLLNVGLVTNDDEELIELEWEASLSATLLFLKQAGSCQRLRLTLGDDHLIRSSAIFAAVDFSTSSIINSKNEMSFARNVFVPLWEASSPNASFQLAQETKRLAEANQREQVKAEKQQKEREESDRLQSKKNQLESDLVLTGIVNNGREPMAFINSRQNGGQTMMLHAGDIVQEARVSTIDEQRGFVQLDYDGKFQISLKLNSRNIGAFQ